MDGSDTGSAAAIILAVCVGVCSLGIPEEREGKAVDGDADKTAAGARGRAVREEGGVQRGVDAHPSVDMASV